MPDDLGAGQPGEFLGIVTRDALVRSPVADDGDQGVPVANTVFPAGRGRLTAIGQLIDRSWQTLTQAKEHARS